MTSHVIADPATAPATAPAGKGWAALSAALTAEVEPIAGRDDLIVTIAPGAAHGHPAVFFPGHAAIELDGNHLGIHPATAKPHRNSDRTRYAPTWGALTHECAHARHSVWEPPRVADPAVVEIAMLLEESRIEGAHIRRRPDDRHWLRASATEFVLGGSDGSTAAMNDYAAAYNAALVLGRVDAGILDPAEAAPAATAIESILGTDKLERLRAIWRHAHTTADDDTATMLELARQWLDIVGPDPHAEPEPGSALSGAVAESMARVARAVAAHVIERDPAELAEAAARAEAEAEREASEIAAKVFGTRTGRVTTTRSTRAPEATERSAARVLARALSAANARERAVTKTTAALPPGRLRMRGVLARDAQRAAGAVPTAEPFTRAVRKPVPVPPLRVGIACDISGSMTRYAAPVASAAWIIAYATRIAALTTGTDTATVTFGEKVKPVTRPGITPTQVAEFTSDDNWEAIDEAIDALDGALGLSKPENARLLVIISDGHFDDRPRAQGQKRLDRLRASGCALLWLAPGKSADPMPGATVHIITDPASTAAEIGRAATKAVRNA
ncbi:VWA domain-containing protein [Nocardia sp. CS682]|uniref:VWA domain-containing protein n=1 Tax=Nocardia sp. CS682 TaxID=1047172 RepID=UPI001074C568|nr:VWA domain-containing protein [Nocardia sp. CS682]QBS41351.1 hypothetical protein DMB37_15680 [Nocardia sp. CS682]